jgi:predicted PurR-regulated permease PerM
MALCLVPDQHRVMTDVLGREVAGKLRGYLQGVALSGLAVGVLTGAGLAILGVPYALLFGVLAGFLEAIPFFGPLLAAIGPFTLALSQSPTRALIIAVFFVAVQQIEDKALVPRLQSHTTGLHPLTVILASLVLGSLFGLLGVLLAVPLAAVGQALAVCVISCFYYPEGTSAWLAERRPEPMSEEGQGASTPADPRVVEEPV